MAIILNKLNKTALVDGEYQNFQFDEVNGHLRIKQTVKGSVEVKASAGFILEDYSGNQLILETVNAEDGSSENVSRLKFVNSNGDESVILQSENGNLTLVNNVVYTEVTTGLINSKTILNSHSIHSKNMEINQNLIIEGDARVAGSLILDNYPIDGLHAVNKNYLEEAVTKMISSQNIVKYQLIGCVSAAYATNISLNDHIKFNTIVYQTSSDPADLNRPTLDTTTAYVSTTATDSIGRIKLPPNKKFRVEAQITHKKNSSIPFKQFLFWDVETNTQIGLPIYSTAFDSSTAYMRVGRGVCIVETGAQAKRIEIRIGNPNFAIDYINGETDSSYGAPSCGSSFLVSEL